MFDEYTPFGNNFYLNQIYGSTPGSAYDTTTGTLTMGGQGYSTAFPEEMAGGDVEYTSTLDLDSYYDFLNNLDDYGWGGGGGYTEPEEQDYSLTDYFGGKDTEGYKKYKQGQQEGRWEDLPDFIAQGGDQSGEIYDPMSYVEDLINQQQEQIEEETSYIEEYLEENPFAFDEELARESVTAEYEPYYSELLEDYTTDVEAKRESLTDDMRLLNTLEEYDQRAASRSFNRAVTKAEEGFAGSGLFFSGIKKRAIGEEEVDYRDERELSSEKFGHRRRDVEREREGLERRYQRRIRDIGREKEEAIESGILGREGEYMTEYYTPLVESYTRRFGGSNQGVLGGYLPPEYLRY